MPAKAACHRASLEHNHCVVLQRPEATALAVGGDGRLVYVGSSQAAVHVARSAEVVNLQGAFVAPVSEAWQGRKGPTGTA